MRRGAVLLLMLCLTACTPDGSEGAAGPTGGQPGTPTSSVPTPETTSPSPSQTGPTEPAWRSFLRDQLAADPSVRREMFFDVHPRGVVQCAMWLLAANRRHNVRFAFVACGDYRTGPKARLISASSVPAVLRLRGAPGQRRLADVRFPRQAHLDADIERLFPPDVAHDIRYRTGMSFAPTDGELLAAAKRLPDVPPCIVSTFRAHAITPGGAALGSWYAPVRVTNTGPACVLSSMELTLWAGTPARRLTALDLRDHAGKALVLGQGQSVRLRASAPNEQCVLPAGARRTPWGFSGPAAAAADLQVSGLGLPAGFLGCPAVQFIADRAAGSR